VAPQRSFPFTFGSTVARGSSRSTAWGSIPTSSARVKGCSRAAPRSAAVSFIDMLRQGEGSCIIRSQRLMKRLQLNNGSFSMNSCSRWPGRRRFRTDPLLHPEHRSSRPFGFTSSARSSRGSCASLVACKRQSMSAAHQPRRQLYREHRPADLASRSPKRYPVFERSLYPASAR
jgi:hypothetical protein